VHLKQKQMNNIPNVTKNLLIINILMYLATVVLQTRFGIDLSDYLGLHFFLASDFKIWQLFTYMFMHGSFMHVFFNMFAVWVQYVQYAVDLSHYTQVNTGYSVISMDEYLNMLTTVGASGAVYGILLGFGMTFPEDKIFIFPLPVPIKAKYFVMIYAVIELLEGFSQFDNVAHFAHLGGMIFGYILIRYWRKKHNNNGYYYQ